MRATSNPPSLAGIADAVWDELLAGHGILTSFGQRLTQIHTYTGNIKDDYARRLPYTYGPTNLAAGATYVPAAGTVVTVAALDGAGAQDFKVMHGAIAVMDNIANSGLVDGYVGMLYCDGTDVGIKNGSGGGLDLSIEGFTI